MATSAVAHLLGSNNCYNIDPNEAEIKIREKEPLLLHPNEHVVLAFKSRCDPRDKSYLTSQRILLKNGKGWGKKRKNFQSYPYESIRAFSVVETTTTTTLTTPAAASGGSGSTRSGGGAAAGGLGPQPLAISYSEAGSCDNESLVSAGQHEEEGAEFDGEQQQQQQKSHKHDVELIIWTSSYAKVRIEFGKGDVDIFHIQQFMNEKCLRVVSPLTKSAPGAQQECALPASAADPQDMVITVSNNSSSHDGSCTGSSSNNSSPVMMIDWLFDVISSSSSAVNDGNKVRYTPAELTYKLRSTYPILLENEVIEVAYQSSWNDYTVLTNRRLISMDVRGGGGGGAMSIVSSSNSSSGSLVDSSNSNSGSGGSGSINKSTVQLKSIPWEHVCGYTMETKAGSGSFNLAVVTDASVVGGAASVTTADADTTAELKLYTSIGGGAAYAGECHTIEQDVRNVCSNSSSSGVWAIQACINKYVLTGSGQGEVIPTDATDPVKDVIMGQQMVDIPNTSSWWERRNNSQPLDTVEMNNIFHISPPLLQSTEMVEMAFMGDIEIVLFTTERCIKVSPTLCACWNASSTNVADQERMEYTSIPWKSAAGFAVETVGGTSTTNNTTSLTDNTDVTTDSQIRLWTEMMYSPGDEPEPFMSMWEFGVNKKMVDVFAVKQYLSNKCLRVETDDASFIQQVAPLHPCIISMNQSTSASQQEQEERLEKCLSCIGGFDQRGDKIIDPHEMNILLHTMVPILLTEEHIVMAFKAAGRNSDTTTLTLFTSLRVVVMDIQGYRNKSSSAPSSPNKRASTAGNNSSTNKRSSSTGISVNGGNGSSNKKVQQYHSIPYKSIRAFSAKSVGSWDKNAEIKLYTRNLWTMGTYSLDFRKGKADINVIQRFLSAIIVGTKGDKERFLLHHTDNGSGVVVFQPKPEMAVDHKSSVDSFISWFANINTISDIDAKAVSQKLQSSPSILLHNERCEKAFRCGRDMYVYTNMRVLKMDVQAGSLSGKKVEYFTIPIKYVGSFEVETAGFMDNDAELYIQASIPKLKRVKEDILVKQGDIMYMHAYMTMKKLS